MTSFEVDQYGFDHYGRPVFLTAFMADWLEHRWSNLGFRLEIAQGAFMERIGGGAKASEGAHDQGGCVDFIIPSFTDPKALAAVWEFRQHGGGAFRRDRSPKYGGMPLHLHVTLAADQPLSPMAQILWSSYAGGGDGLGAGAGRPGNAPDYERRPSPLVLTPPPEEDRLMVTKEDEKAIEAVVERVMAKFLRDSDGGLPDIGNARIVRPDGTVTTLAKVAQEVHNLASNGVKGSDT